MTARASGYKPQSIPGPRPAHSYQRATTSGLTLYNGGVTAYDPTTGLWLKPDGTNPNLVCSGILDIGDLDNVNTTTDTGEKLVRSGCFKLVSSGLTIANEGVVVFAADDQTFALSQGTAPILGILEEVVDATHGFVLIDPIINLALAGLGSQTNLVVGSALTDANSTQITRAGRRTWVTLPAATLSTNRSYALPALASSLPGDEVIVTRLDVTANTATFTDSGSGTPTLLVMPASKVNSATFILNAAGTHWLLLSCGSQ